MPIWLSIIFAVIGAIGTILGIFGFTAYMGERAKKKAQRRNEDEDHIKQLRKQEYENLLRNIIREENKPINDKLVQMETTFDERLSKLETGLNLNTEGTVTLLRNDMKKSLDKCREKGFATTTDHANWNELYATYAKLGGNHFQEYVNGWKDEMNGLPSKKKTRQRLNEVKK